MAIPTDPGIGLTDGVDTILLAGTTGLHQRFLKLYNKFNGDVDHANMNLADDFTWSGNHKFNDLATVGGGLSNNARLTLSGGVLSLVGDDGQPPSSTNPVSFKVPSSTAGKWDYVTFTSSSYCVINDDNNADSYFDGGGGTTFGSTAAVAWAVDHPFAIYVATDGTNPCLFLSRNPRAQVLPAATGIGYKDSPPATPSQYNFFAMTANNIKASFASKPCWLIGSLRMRKSSSDDWTIQTLDTGDGVDNFNNFKGREFITPAGQNGATSGKYFVDGGGTAAVFSTNYSGFKIGLDGRVYKMINFSGDGGTDGAGAVNLTMSLPYKTSTSPGIFSDYVTGKINFWIPSGTFFGTVRLFGNDGSATFYIPTIAGANLQNNIRLVQHADLPNGFREIEGEFSYTAFD